MCRVLKISESGYYRWLRNRSKPKARELLSVEIQAILDKHPDNDNYGVNRMMTALEQAGIKKHRFHDLRHTAAVNMLAGGLDLKSVSTILGHSDIGTTANVYLVFTETLQKQAAEKLQAWLTREA